MKNNKVKFNKNHLLILFSVMLICLLGTVFGVTYAYVTGSFSNNPSGNDNASSQNPYLTGSYYYFDGTTNYKISSNAISGSISDDGTVTLQVVTTDGTKTISIGQNNTFSLPIRVKNEGNINGEVFNVQALIKFFNGENEIYSENQSGIGDYYLQINSSNFTVENNSTLAGMQDIEIDGYVNLIDSLVVSNEIADSELCGLNFKISLNCDLGQEDIDSINVGI